jgi:hypothetical protein
MLFYDGELVEVVASSHNKKTIGPKKGSLAFFGNIIHQEYIKDAQMFGYFVNLLYVRYGYEKRSRAEKRLAIACIPSSDSVTRSLTKHTENTLQKINRGKLDAVLQQMIDNYSLDSKTTLVALSRHYGTFGDIENIEKNIWFVLETMAFCNNHRMTLNEMCNNGHASKTGIPWLHQDVLNTAMHLLENRSDRNLFFDGAGHRILQGVDELRSGHRCEDFLQALKYALLVTRRTQFRGNTEKSVKRMLGSGVTCAHDLYRKYASYVMLPEIAKELYSPTNSSTGRNFHKRLKEIREVIESHAQ